VQRVSGAVPFRAAARAQLRLGGLLEEPSSLPAMSALLLGREPPYARTVCTSIVFGRRGCRPPLQKRGPRGGEGKERAP
jgi:hypothetical protein